MENEAGVTLQHVRDLLKELGNATVHLINAFPESSRDPGLDNRLEDFKRVFEEATQRLSAPTLSIATIGTTSSGKSTIVNALIGRKVAPIEAGEMSGGVLTLRLSDACRLVVEETKNATWETGEWCDLTDEQIYDRVRNVMFSYHDARKTQKECIAPQVTVFGSLLPASDRSLLELPPGVGIEFIDLPGLKSIQDRDNLKIIQERVHKAFSLVALDYMQVDDEHRRRLLEELKRVVNYLQGRTDSMIFILNRVDQRGQDDIPIEQRVSKLKEEIQAVLELKEPPEVLPFSARLLYYAQCAWGARSTKLPSNIEPEKRSRLLKAMFQDCATIIYQYKSADRELRHWLHDVEDWVHDGKKVNDDIMQQLLRFAMEWSGGNQLWNRMKVRVSESFSELIVLPALVEVFDTYDALETAVDSLISIRRIQRKEEVEAAQEKITGSREKLRQEIAKVQERFRAGIREKIELLQKNTPESRSLVAQKCKEEGLQGFQLLIEAVGEIEGDLIQEVVIPVRDAIKKNESAYDLEKTLAEVTKPALSNSLARAYDLASRKLNGFVDDSSGNLVKKVPEEDSRAAKELENAERSVHILYAEMREVLSARAEFTLQARAKTLENALQLLVERECSEILNLCLEELPSLELEKTIMALFKTVAHHTPPTLPEKFFEIPLQIESESVDEKVSGGKSPKTITVEPRGCCSRKKTKTIFVDNLKNVRFVKMTLPNAYTMSSNWEDGIARGRDSLWDVLCIWIVHRLDWVGKTFDDSVREVIDLTDRALERQLLLIEEDFEAEAKLWDFIENLRVSTSTLCQKLEKVTRS